MSENGQNGNGRGRVSKVPPPLNPHDPLNQVLYSLGGEEKNGFRTLPGIDGIPHRTRGPGTRFYKKDDPEHLQPQQGGQVRCRVFEVTNNEDRIDYEQTVSKIYTMAMGGKAKITSIDRQFCPDKSGWLIFIEWIEYFTYDSVGKHQRSEGQTEFLRR